MERLKPFTFMGHQCGNLYSFLFLPIELIYNNKTHSIAIQFIFNYRINSLATGCDDVNNVFFDVEFLDHMPPSLVPKLCQMSNPNPNFIKFW